MTPKNFFNYSCLSLLTTSLFLTGCTSNPTRKEQQNIVYQNNTPTVNYAADETNTPPCSTTKSAIAGGATGALLGALIGGKKGAAKGALIGGVIASAACISMKMNSKQTKSAAQLEQDYKRVRGNLPPSPTVVNYQSKLDQRITNKGQSFNIISIVDVVNGYQEPVQNIVEEVIVYDPNGQKLGGTSKPFRASTAGGFENNFDINLGKNVSQGIYPVVTNLYINGRLAATSNLQTQIVQNNTGEISILAKGY